MKEFIVPIADEGNASFVSNDLKLQELVRCKDCIFNDNPEERASETYWMPCDEYKTDGNWFCGWGKRKEV